MVYSTKRNSMKFRGYITCIVLALLVSACNRTPSNEKAELPLQAERLNQWIATARNSTLLSLQQRQQLLHRAHTYAQKLSDDSLRLAQLSEISRAYLLLKDSIGFRTTNRELLQAAQAQNHYPTLANTHWHLAFFFESKGIQDSAFYHYRNALRNLQQLPADSTNHSQRGRKLYSMSKVQNLYKDYLGADINLTRAIDHFRQVKDHQWLYRCYNMLAMIAAGQNELDRAIRHFTQAQNHLKQAGFAEQESKQWILENNIAYAYLKKEDYAKARELYTALLSNPRLKQARSELYGIVMASQAYTWFKEEQYPKKAEALLKQAIAFNESNNFWYDQPRAQLYYAELRANQGDTLTALKHAHKGLALAQNASDNEQQLNLLKLLTRLKPEHATTYAEDYFSLSEQIQNEERTQRNKFARLSLETDDVIAENQVLIRQTELQIMWVTILGIVMIVGGTFAIFYIRIRSEIHRQKQKQSSAEIYNLMVNQHSKIEEGRNLEKKRISEELHDGVLGRMLGMRLILMALNKKTDDYSVTEREKMFEELQEIEVKIRSISHDLHDEAYEEFKDFVDAIEKLLMTIRKAFKKSCTFTYTRTADWNKLPGSVKMHLYRILQECIKNCTTHAQCSTIDVDLSLEGRDISLTISDNGKGFDMQKRKKGIGLDNINSRLEKIEGKLNISSTPNKGTTVKIVTPDKYFTPDAPLRDDPK